MKKLICAAVIGFCFLWIIGTAGSLECEAISIAEFVAREIPALVVLYLGFKIGGFAK